MKSSSPKRILTQSIWFSSQASRQLKSLKPVFEKLLWVHESYIETESYDSDCAFWYGERPNISLLSAAVWLHGGIALEEYGAEKKNGRGRCDLYFRVGNTSFGCEAKHLFLKLGRSDGASAHKVCEKLEEAKRDAVHAIHDENVNVLGLCFVTPMIHEKRLSGLNEYLREMESLKNDFCCSALVWIGVPKGDKPLAGDRMQFFPGTFLAIKEVK